MQPFDVTRLEAIYGKLDQVTKIVPGENFFSLTTKGGKDLTVRNLVFVHHTGITLMEAVGKLFFIDPRIIPSPFD